MHCPPQAPHHVHARPLGVGAVGRSRPLVRSATGASNELALTDAGAALVRRLRPEHDEFLAAQFDVLDDDELHQLATLWAKVSDSV